MRLARWSAMAVCSALLGACSSQPPAPAAPPKPPAPKAATVVARDAAAPEPAPYVYSYNPLAKRDPFRSLMEEVRSPVAESSACSEPLCQWDLGQLTLVAVVTGEANPLAMLEDPVGRGHLIRRSSRVGKQGGKVTQILRDTVTVTEFWTGPDGKVNPNPTTLHMKPDKALVPDLDLATGKKYP